jgi:regulator of sigma E protease
MTWVLTVAGFAALILLHEFGHFAVAKAVGMRVERFALFFPPLLFKVRRGETEYGIGAIPLGGYVRITGMNPTEEIAPEVEHRAYYRQPVWKRIVVIAAGPAMNVLVAFLILWVLFMSHGSYGKPTNVVAKDGLRPPAASVLRPGDRIISVDGHGGSPQAIRAQIAKHRCAGRQINGCTAATPALVVIERAGRRLTVQVRPRYDSVARRPLIGFVFDQPLIKRGPVSAANTSLDRMWFITSRTVSAMAHIFEAKQRKQISGLVGTSDVLNQQIKYSASQALLVLAIISMSLAIVNLFPFLPLDGGHIFWALAEKVRGRPIPFSVMERAGAVGFVLVLMLFVIGLTNDLDRLRGEGFQPR